MRVSILVGLMVVVVVGWVGFGLVVVVAAAWWWWWWWQWVVWVAGFLCSLFWWLWLLWVGGG